MNNNVLLAYCVKILPFLTLAFVGILLLYKFYFKIRSKYSIKVNCWFCNTNSKVPYSEANSWTCTSCEQYNGFTKDGDYNRVIKEQFDCSSTNGNGLNNTHQWLCDTNPQNGFCDSCNEAQRLKIEKISQFEPKKESRFDAELKEYKAQLENQYRLCSTCERHLKAVLRNKKKMVLGSKFLEFIMKSAEAIKDPHIGNIRLAQQLLWKRRLTFVITILTLVNLCCLTGLLPDLNRIWFMQVFGDFLGSQVFVACSHLNAFWRLLLSYLNNLMDNETVIRLGLFTRTIFMMLLYSLGLRLPQIVRLNFISIYLLTAPFCILATIFSYNVIDKFKLTRYTILLVLWSIYAGGLLEQSTNNVHQILMFAASILTTLLTFTNKIESSPKLYDKNANSFHKIYDDDYASELDTATSSVLSYQLEHSTSSAKSDISHSFSTLKQRSIYRPMESTSPISSSTLSLNLTPRSNKPTFEMKSPLTSSTFSLNQTPLSTARDFYRNTNGTMDSFYSTKSIKSQNNLYSRTLNPILNSAFALNQNAFNNNESNRSLTQAEQLNSTFMTANLNNSFASSLNGYERTQTPRLLEHPHLQFNNQFNNSLRLQQQQTHMPAPSIRSAFSTSTTALHNAERFSSRLVSPSRLSLNNTLVGFVNVNTNSSGNNLTSNTASIFDQSKLQPSRNFSSATLGPIDEDISRASSRSSGFESQNGHLNNSRENSYGNLEIDLPNKTSSLVNNSAKGFQSLDHNNHNNNIDNTFSLLSLQQPHSSWQSNSRTNLFNQSSIRPGDLLRKWKDSTVI